MKTEEKKDKELDKYISFLINSTSQSYINNSDGDGIYLSNSDYIVKSPNKINILGFKKEINKSNVFISHQRLATHGKTEQFIQPFDNEEFVLIHNGIMAEYSRGKKSDSFGFFIDFYNKFKKGVGEREETIIKIIQDLTKDTYGSFSICLYDKKTEKVYYFKNTLTDIKVYRGNGKKELYITTYKDNKYYLDLYKEFGEIEIKSNKIYRFSFKNDKILVHEIGNLNPMVNYFYSNKDNLTYWDNRQGKGTTKDKAVLESMFSKECHIKDIQDGYFKSITTTAKEGLCDCGVPTHNFDKVMNRFICNDCINDDIEEEVRDYKQHKIGNINQEYLNKYAHYIEYV